jgi:hypothetical protein
MFEPEIVADFGLTAKSEKGSVYKYAAKGRIWNLIGEIKKIKNCG